MRFPSVAQVNSRWSFTSGFWVWNYQKEAPITSSFLHNAVLDHEQSKTELSVHWLLLASTCLLFHVFKFYMYVMSYSGKNRNWTHANVLIDICFRRKCCGNFPFFKSLGRTSRLHLLKPFMTIYLKEVAFFNKQSKMVLHIRRLDLNAKSKQSM